MFHPQRVLISRNASDPEQEQWQLVPGLVICIPSVGKALQMLLDTGRMIHTSHVTYVEHDGTELVVETLNTQYRLKLAPPDESRCGPAADERVAA
jgi:hypothetical protein